MKTFLKAHWRKIVVVLVCAIFAIALFLRPQWFATPIKPDPTAQTVKDLQKQLFGISEQLDSANIRLKEQDKALTETLSKLKSVEWQLVISTQIAQRNLDSLSAKFDREAAKENDNELLKGLGL